MRLSWGHMLCPGPLVNISFDYILNKFESCLLASPPPHRTARRSRESTWPTRGNSAASAKEAGAGSEIQLSGYKTSQDLSTEGVGNRTP